MLAQGCTSELGQIVSLPFHTSLCCFYSCLLASVIAKINCLYKEQLCLLVVLEPCSAPGTNVMIWMISATCSCHCRAQAAARNLIANCGTYLSQQSCHGVQTFCGVHTIHGCHLHSLKNMCDISVSSHSSCNPTQSSSHKHDSTCPQIASGRLKSKGTLQHMQGVWPLIPARSMALVMRRPRKPPMCCWGLFPTDAIA